ncbi:Aflatoxin biosynthesis regulatory protein [Penicillium camemberti]|uniref:Aflatoxin biosynthesis regulatory protein n=1 Tax=Penicillium camemberti (strain FM 013) TaxID=1429867 RepID=A0A0G4PEY2_PENC3|nr:Aflatoxin biosynthesis regulatory protein [Penicillium camemberti]
MNILACYSPPLYRLALNESNQHKLWLIHAKGVCNFSKSAKGPKIAKKNLEISWNAISTLMMFVASQETPMHTHHQNQSKPSKPQRLAFRSSCDPCAASKVRCTKEQLGCSRCVQNGLKCVYGRSRRKGKPPSNKTAPIHAPVHHPYSRAPVSPPAPPAPPIPAQPSWTPGPNHHQPNYNHSCSWYRASNPTEWERRRNTLTPSLTPSLTPGAGISHLSTPEFGWPSMLGSDPMVTDSHSLGSLPEMRGMDDENGGGQEGDEVQHNPEDDQHESCIAVACRTLSSLYQFVQSDCVNGHSTNSNQSRSMLKPPTPEVSPANDIVFCTTRFATETVSRLLNCTARSCAGDPSILLVLGSILLRILTWYEALYQSEIGELGLSATPSPSGREDVGLDGSHSSVTHSIGLSQPSESMEESIYTVPLTIPLTIGTFNLSLATETKMKAQLLLCEVQTLSQVCQALGRRVQAAESIRGEKDLCGQSNTHLLRKLGELRHALTAVCTQVPSLG